MFKLLDFAMHIKLTLFFLFVHFMSFSQLENDPDLIAYYPFNGDSNDISINGFHASLVGPAIYTQDRFGNPNSAFEFDGSSNYFLINNVNPLFKPTTFPISIAVWLKIPVNFQGQFNFFKNDFANEIYTGIRGTVIPSGNVTINLENGGAIGPQSRNTKTGITNIKDGQWHLITCIVRGFNNMEIYIDCRNDLGTYSGGGTSLVYNQSNPGIVGAFDATLGNAGLDYSSGTIDQLIFIKRELSETEISDMIFIDPLTITGNLTFCAGSFTTLNANGGLSYLWSNGSSQQEIEIDAGGEYSVTINGPNFCTKTLNVVVEELPSPAISIIASGNTSFCIGESVLLTVITNVSFVWEDGTNVNPRIVNSSGIYYATTTDSGPCQNVSNEIEVTVYPFLPTPIINY